MILSTTVTLYVDLLYYNFNLSFQLATVHVQECVDMNFKQSSSMFRISIIKSNVTGKGMKDGTNHQEWFL